MAYAPKPGCPLCSIVSSASHATPNSPLSPSFPVGSTQPEVLWRDDNFTAYREKAHPLSTKGHIIVAFKFVLLSYSTNFFWLGLQFACAINIHPCALLLLLLIACSSQFVVFKWPTATGQHQKSGNATARLPSSISSSYNTLWFPEFYISLQHSVAKQQYSISDRVYYPTIQG